MTKNIFAATISILALLAVGLGCNSLGSKETANNAAPANRPVNTTGTAPGNSTVSTNSAAPTTSSKKVEKADFTATAEELDKIFTKDGVTDKDLEKYENKNIAVSGRVSLLVTEKTGTVQPWVTLYAPGTLHGVSCYFDDENVDQMKALKEDKIVKVQGFQDDFIVPTLSPKLKHCVVLEAN
ncbi:MAG TPA: hypothetical protein VK612_11380 [Pyrinomonadaceae bacterium]|nr:hypothetical protein [Pyrinomonadaceae bacterium]